MKATLFALLGLSGLVLFVRPASAHEVRPAYLEIQERTPDHFDVLWKQPSRGTFVLRLKPTVSNGLFDAPADEQYASDSFVVQRWSRRHLARDSFDAATVSIRWLEYTITDVLVNVGFVNGQQIQTVLKPERPEFTIRLTGTGRLSMPAYLTLGIEHILTGFDHLGFVLGLVLLVRGRARLFQTITAFTFAHSITLVAAALGYVQVNAPLVESLVALSIVFVAAELIHCWRGHQGLTIRYPWLIAFTFGLLHGFAFAGSLTDIGLPPHNIPGALLLFNCGVEIGQLLFVGAALPLIALLGRWQRGEMENYGRWFVAYGVGALASYWMLQRLNLLAQ